MSFIEGWFNQAKSSMGLLDEETKALGESRLAICAKCPLRNNAICDPTRKGKHVKTGETKRGCGCILTAKVKSKSSKCPLGKW